MTYRTYETDEFALPLPISQVARDTAQQFAREQPTPEKAEQVRLNTLAVLVVHDYLQLMGIPTDLGSSDSWNPVMRLCANVADLELPGIGRLECRPISANTNRCPVPPEVWEDRLGYVIVQLEDTFQDATIRGFVPAIAVEELPLAQLRSPEDLLDHLFQLSQAQLPQAAPGVTVEGAIANLSQWLNNIVEAGWQTLDDLFSTGELTPAYAFRYQPDAPPAETVTRAALFSLNSDRVALVLELQLAESGQTNIRLRVYPTGNLPYLPAHLELIVLDETGATFVQAQARTTDDYIQLELSGDRGERFTVQLTLGTATVTQNFVI